MPTWSSGKPPWSSCRNVESSWSAKVWKKTQTTHPRGDGHNHRFRIICYGVSFASALILTTYPLQHHPSTQSR